MTAFWNSPLPALILFIILFGISLGLMIRNRRNPIPVIVKRFIFSTPPSPLLRSSDKMMEDSYDIEADHGARQDPIERLLATLITVERARYQQTAEIEEQRQWERFNR